jgi:hypothetical protein
MTKQQPVTPAPGAPAGQPSRRSAWMWVSIVLAVVAIGLLVWALSTKSDLNSTQSDLDKANQQIAQLNTKSEQSKGVASTITAAGKAAFNALAQQLGVTSADLAATQQQLQTAQQNAQQAAQQAQDKTKSKTEQLQAQVNEAKANASVAANCAKASLSAIGGLFDGNGIISQLPTVKSNLQSIGTQCKTALSGT